MEPIRPAGNPVQVGADPRANAIAEGSIVARLQAVLDERMPDANINIRHWTEDEARAFLVRLRPILNQPMLRPPRVSCRPR